MPTRRKTSRTSSGAAPFLKNVSTAAEAPGAGQFPYSIPVFSHGVDISFTTPVTFFVGENGSGKSTLLEAIAYLCGFNVQGGNRNHRYGEDPETPALAADLRLSWLPKVTQGFFLRAESFFNFAGFVDDHAFYDAYGGTPLHAQSHGESFLSVFENRLSKGIYIVDEPEAALSPQRQLSFLKIIYEVEQTGRAQFLIATHSPILLTYPNATVLSLDGPQIRPVDYRETQHVRITKEFLNAPELFFRYLFAPSAGPGGTD